MSENWLVWDALAKGCIALLAFMAVAQQVAPNSKLGVLALAYLVLIGAVSAVVMGIGKP